MGERGDRREPLVVKAICEIKGGEATRTAAWAARTAVRTEAGTAAGTAAGRRGGRRRDAGGGDSGDGCGDSWEGGDSERGRGVEEATRQARGGGEAFWWAASTARTRDLVPLFCASLLRGRRAPPPACSLAGVTAAVPLTPLHVRHWRRAVSCTAV